MLCLQRVRGRAWGVELRCDYLLLLSSVYLSRRGSVVNNLFSSIWTFIVCEKYLRSAIKGCKLGALEDLIYYVIEKPEL